jgi:hypothetical protein
MGEVYNFESSNIIMSVAGLLFSLAFLAFVYFFGEAPVSWTGAAAAESPKAAAAPISGGRRK